MKKMIANLSLIIYNHEFGGERVERENVERNGEWKKDRSSCQMTANFREKQPVKCSCPWAAKRTRNKKFSPLTHLPENLLSLQPFGSNLLFCILVSGVVSDGGAEL